jgi:WD40 repeat protein
VRNGTFVYFNQKLSIFEFVAPSLTIAHKVVGEAEILDVSFSSTSSAYLYITSDKVTVNTHPSNKLIFGTSAPAGSVFRAAQFVRGADGDTVYVCVNARNRKRGDIYVYDSEGSVINSKKVSDKVIVSFTTSRFVHLPNSIYRCGDYLAVATQDLKIIILEARALATVATFTGTHDFPITSLVFSADSERLISGSADGSVLVHVVPGIQSGGAWIWALLFAIVLVGVALWFESGENSFV